MCTLLARLHGLLLQVIIQRTHHPYNHPDTMWLFYFFLLKQGTLWGCRQTHGLTLVSMFSIHSACLHVTMITVNRTSPSALWVHTSTPIRSLSDIPKVHLLLWKHNKTEKLKKKKLCQGVSRWFIRSRRWLSIRKLSQTSPSWSVFVSGFWWFCENDIRKKK